MISQASFLELVAELDVEKIDLDTLHALDLLVYANDFNHQSLAVTAAKALRGWVFAAHKYSTVMHSLAMRRRQCVELEQKCEAKQKIIEANVQTVQSLQVQIATLKAQYDRFMIRNELHRRTCKVAKIRYETSCSMIESIKFVTQRIEAKISDINTRVNLAFSQSLVACCVIGMLGTFSGSDKKKIVSEWIKILPGYGFNWDDTVQFDLAKVLGREGLSETCHLLNLAPDSYLFDACLMAKYHPLPPLFFDSHHLAEDWIRALDLTSRRVVKYHQQESDLKSKLDNAITQKWTVILVISDYDLEKWIIDCLKLSDTSQPQQEFKFQIILITNEDFDNAGCVWWMKYVNPIRITSCEHGTVITLMEAICKISHPTLSKQWYVNRTETATGYSLYETNLLKAAKLLGGLPKEKLYELEMIQTVFGLESNIKQVMETISGTDTIRASIEIGLADIRKVCEWISSIHLSIQSVKKADSACIYTREWLLQTCKAIAVKQNLAIGESSADFSSFLKSFIQEIISIVGNSISNVHRLSFLFKMAMLVAAWPMSPISDDILPNAYYEFLFHKNETEVFSIGSDIKFKNPASSWLPSASWKKLVQLSLKFPEFTRLVPDFGRNANRSTTPSSDSCWEDIYKSSIPENLPLPSRWETSLSKGQKMMILCCLRPDILSVFIKDYTKRVLGCRIDYPVFIVNDRAGLENTKGIIVIQTRSDIPHSSEQSLLTLRKTSIKLGKSSMTTRVQTSQDAEVLLINLATIMDSGGWIILQPQYISHSLLIDIQRAMETYIALKAANKEFRIWIVGERKDIICHSWILDAVRIVDNVKSFRSEFGVAFQNVAENISPSNFVACVLYRRALFNLCAYVSTVRFRQHWSPGKPLEATDISDEDYNLSIKLLKSNFAKAHAANDAITQDLMESIYKAIFASCFSPCAKNARDIAWLWALFIDIMPQEYIDLVKKPDLSCFISQAYHATIRGELTSAYALVQGLPCNPDQEYKRLRMGAHAKTVIAEQETRDLVRTLQTIEPNKMVLQVDLSAILQDFVLKLEKYGKKAIFKRGVLESREDNKKSGYYIDGMLRKNVQDYKKLVERLQRSTEKLLRQLSGQELLDDTCENALQELGQKQVPRVWRQLNTFFRRTELSAWMENIFERVDYVENWHNLWQKGHRMVYSYDLSKVYNPIEFLQGKFM